MQRNWQTSETNRIRQLAPTGFLSPAVLDQLSRELDRTPAAIRTQRTKLDLCRGNRPPRDWLDQFHPTQGELDTSNGQPSDDGSFAGAMLKAAWAGTEHPPMIGVDKRPCTKAPIFVTRGDRDAVLTQSAIAEF